MSTEAKGDGQRDVASAGEPATAGGETPVPAGASAAAGAVTASAAAGAPASAETSASEDAAGGGGAGGDGAGGTGEAGGTGKAGGAGGAGEAGEHDGGAGDGAGAEGGPGEPIELAEPVELDEPAAAFGASRRWTRLLLAVGFVVAAAAVIGGAIAIVGSVTHGFSKPVKVTYKKSAVFSLRTGDCFNPVGQQSYSLIPCDSPHRAEVFATFALSGTTWPGIAAVESAASSGCASRLTGYLNPQLALSLASAYVYPDATAWQAGTRTVICEVRADSGEITGSVRGAASTG